MNDDNFATGYALGRDSSGNGSNGMWGGDWAWWIVILLIFGWGNNGFGGNGMNGALTRGDLCQDMNFNNLDSAVRSLQSGLCDGFYAMNTSLLTGFGNTNTAILQNGYETRSAISDLGFRTQDCCCQTQRAIDGVNYNMAKNTCDLQNTMNSNTRDIIQSQQAGTQRILDYLCNEKISALQSENALLTAQLSQNSQTRTIIEALQPVAKPAYLTCSPYESSYGFGRTGYGYGNGGCGCGCGCGCNG